MSKLKSILAQNPTIRSASKRTFARVQRDTLVKARAKCIKKVRDNKEWHRDQTLPKPDSIMLPDAASNYSVGVKYGNRYLTHIFDGNTYIENVPESALDEVFDALIEMVETGECDKAIKEAMDANLAMHAKR